MLSAKLSLFISLFCLADKKTVYLELVKEEDFVRIT